MRPVSEEFLRTLRGSHKMFARARVLVDFQVGVGPTGTEIPIFDGQVRADSSADVRTSLTLSTGGTGLWPVRSTDLLTPYGNEIFVERGIDYGNGTIEVVSLGYYRVNNVSQLRGPNGEINVNAQDRMAGIIESRLVTPRQYRANQSIGEVFTDLVLDVYPDAEIIYDFDEEATLLGTSQIAEEDRFNFLKQIAGSRGKIIYWDHTGRLRVVSPPNPTDTVFEINSGRNGNMVQLGRQLTRQGVYNAVVATGESPGDLPPAQFIAYDDNPLSPTYWSARFGHVPRFYYSPFITNNLQAESAAKSLLLQATGLPYSVNFTTIVNPALEPYDPIRVTAPDRIDVHVLDSAVIPLTADAAMTGTTRQLITFNPNIVE